MRNLEVTQEIFRCFGAHDVDGIVELLHPECVIDFYGPEVIPYAGHYEGCLLYTSPSPRDRQKSRMPSSA